MAGKMPAEMFLCVEWPLCRPVVPALSSVMFLLPGMCAGGPVLYDLLAVFISFHICVRT